MFSGITAKHFFNMCGITKYHFCDRVDRTKFHFLKHKNSLFSNMKSEQFRNVKLVPIHINKIHRYRSISEIIRMSFLLTKKNLIRQKLGGAAEAAHHWLAFEATNRKSSIKIPLLYELRRRKYLGLVFQDELLTEHIADAMNVANYLHLTEKNPKEHQRIIKELLDFMLVMAKSGIMHLDFRPENILISDNNDIFVIDWEYATVMHGINPGIYSNFTFGYFCHMLSHTFKTINVTKIELSIIETMGSSFNKEIFYSQHHEGLGRHKALKKLLTYNEGS